MKMVAIISLASMLLAQSGGVVWAWQPGEEDLDLIGQDACSRLLDLRPGRSVEDSKLLAHFCGELGGGNNTCKETKGLLQGDIKENPSIAERVYLPECKDFDDALLSPAAREKYPFQYRNAAEQSRASHDPEVECAMLLVYAEGGKSPEELKPNIEACTQVDAASCRATVEQIRRSTGLKYPIKSYQFKCKGD